MMMVHDLAAGPALASDSAAQPSSLSGGAAQPTSLPNGTERHTDAIVQHTDVRVKAVRLRETPAFKSSFSYTSPSWAQKQIKAKDSNVTSTR